MHDFEERQENRPTPGFIRAARLIRCDPLEKVAPL
jgi:hypothetical protein